jgi:hypothetical protein
MMRGDMEPNEYELAILQTGKASLAYYKDAKRVQSWLRKDDDSVKILAKLLRKYGDKELAEMVKGLDINDNISSRM